MLKTLDEIKKVEMEVTGVINGVDNANLLSVDSTAPVEGKVDEVKAEEEIKEEKKPETKEETAKKEEPEEIKEEKEEKEEEESPESRPKGQDAVQKRIGELTKKWRSTERERDYERQRAEKAEEELTKLKSKIPATAKPKKEDFEDEDQYLEALIDWKADEKLRVAREAAVDKQEKAEDKKAVTEVFQNLDEVMERGREVHEDFDSLVMDKNLTLTPDMVSAILQTENAAEIFYHLGQNPDVAASIADMTPAKAAVEIGKLDVRLGAPPKEEKREEKKETAVETKKVSKAPAPINPVKTDGVVDKRPEDMSPKEYRAWRERNKG